MTPALFRSFFVLWRMVHSVTTSPDPFSGPQVTYDLESAGEDEPGVAKQNERLRFPQTLVDTPLTHPRRGYPLRGWVSTEPRSVSPRTNKVTRRRDPNQSQPIEHPCHSPKKPSF